MVLDPRNIQKLENPTRDAAFHFGAYLQLKKLLKGGNEEYGIIEQDKLLDEFRNHYQPHYHSVLVPHEVLGSLSRFGVIPRNHKKDQRSTQIRIYKHPNPGDVPKPQPVQRKRLYVDQTRVLRGRLQRSEVVDDTQCLLCKTRLSSEQAKQEHLDSDVHKFRLQYRQNRSKFSSTVELSGGHVAAISLVDMANDKDIILREGECRTLIVKVSLNEPYTSAHIFKINELRDVDANPLHFTNNMSIEVSVCAKFDEPGAYIYPLVAKIMPNKIILLKDLIFRVESEIIDQLAPVSPYNHQKSDVVTEMTGPIIPGQELPKPTFKLQIKVGLPTHNIPVVFNKLLIHKLQRYDGITESEDAHLGRILGLLCGLRSYQDAIRQVSVNKAPFIEPLNASNYSERFSLLVDMEELQLQRQIRNYDRKDEKLIQQGHLFLLQIPELSEGRPSVNKGDSVHVRLNTEKPCDVTYEGVIHEVQEQGLLLGLHRQFSTKYKAAGPNPKVDVCFTVSRFCILNMHRALNIMKKDQAFSIVFPKSMDIRPPAKPNKLKKWQNKLIANNPQQQRAIKNIISKTSGNSPYLVFGPPGTGKTVTLVETIVQVWLCNERIPPKQLVCAPSNAACNNIAERLLDALPKAKILRLFSLSTEGGQISDVLLKCSNYDKKKKCVIMPSIEEILFNDIIVITIVSSGRLVSGGARNVFEYVYIDECGQASEPETLIAIAGILTSPSKTSKLQSQLVLAGDPKQLGPVLSSTLAKDFGLGMSLLERLMKYNELYKKLEGSGYDCNYLTKLVQNFRSHPVILNLPNHVFYDNELQVKGNPDMINKAVGWKHLPNKQFPLVFHGIQGIDEREKNSPSYFNRQEIDIVIRYITNLFKTGLPGNYKVQEDDIGVITPYRKQVQKFRKAFSILGWNHIRVGSVEEFQGSEKLIVFISTVRSSYALVEEDYRFGLGFLKNPKRFNVSITRAKALLIVVGNPNILRYDKHWYQLLTYCRNNKAAVGISFPDDDPPDHVPEHVAS